MRFTNKQYDLLKWIVQVIMPALITCIGTIGSAVAWEHTELTLTILGALTAFMGSALGLSSSNYYEGKTHD